MKIKFLVLTALAALSIGSAQAGSTTAAAAAATAAAATATATATAAAASSIKKVTADWGTLSTTDLSYIALSEKAGSTYNEFYTFALNATYDLSASAVANNNPVSILVKNEVILEKKNSNGTYSINNLSNSFFTFSNLSETHDFGNLAAGNYRYQVTGISTGKLTGTGNISTYISPVPEPETCAMLLAGLGLMGFMSRRRKSA